MYDSSVIHIIQNIHYNNFIYMSVYTKIIIIICVLRATIPRQNNYIYNREKKWLLQCMSIMLDGYITLR